MGNSIVSTLRSSGAVPLVTAVLALAAATGCTRKETGPLPAYGSVEARTVDISSKVGGKVTRVLVDEGDRVRKGQVLIRFDARELQDAVSQAQAAFDAAKAREDLLIAGARSQDILAARDALSAAEEQASAARRELTRAEQEFAGHAVPQKILDDAQTQDRLAKTTHAARRADLDKLLAGAREQELREAAAAREEAEAALSSNQVRLEEGELAASVDGTIMHRMVEPGEVVRAAAPLMELGELDHPYIDVYIPEPRVAEARVGSAAQVQVDTLPGQIFSGKVDHIAAEAEFTPKNVETADQRTRLVFRVRVSVTDPEHKLHPGMPGSVIFSPRVAAPAPSARRLRLR